MSSHRPLFSFVCVPVLCFTSTVTAFDSVELLNQKIRRSQLHNSAATATVEHQQVLVESLHLLQADGYASAVEVLAAEKSLRQLRIQQQSAAVYVNFLIKLQEETIKARGTADHGTVDGIFLTIPGLSDSAVTRSMATVRLPKDQQLLQLLKEQTHRERAARRVDARTELIARLKKIGADDHQMAQEIAFAELKRSRDAAMDAQLPEPLLAVHSTIPEFTFDGTVVSNSLELTMLMHRKSEQLQLQANRSALQFEAEYLQTIQQRLSRINPAASPTGESRMIALQLKANTNQLDLIDAQLSHLNLVATNGRVSWHTTAMKETSLENVVSQTANHRIRQAAF